MPRYKKSLGRFKLVTPVNDEFQRYVWTELVNSMQWNPKLIIADNPSLRYWKFQCRTPDGKLVWTIEYDRKQIIVTSDESRFSVRQGLTFDMGNGNLIVGGQEV